ncbi:MAG: MaoC family dehydratase N-terminal domain-containing protein, partial [Burkholderiaceae bacterium]|nr:MaoC family dehydratase N-terminal domain-containing protein [Burkholderiaceae bacterium]
MVPSNENHALADAMVENVPFDELQIGQTASLTRKVERTDIQAFAAVSGDTNPVHMDEAYAETTLFKGIIAHGMLSAALISSVLGNQLPGPGSIYLEQGMRFFRPVHVGDTLTVSVTVISKNEAKKQAEFDCLVLNQKGEKVVSGVARILVPTEKLRVPKISAP